jgi:5-methylcytosine-specific restriction endonuclease McrA
MAFTPTAKLPLSFTPAPIFTDLWDEDDTTQPSDTTAFNEGIDERDDGTCAVCGHVVILEHCHIIPRSEPETVSCSFFYS